MNNFIFGLLSSGLFSAIWGGMNLLRGIEYVQSSDLIGAGIGIGFIGLLFLFISYLVSGDDVNVSGGDE